MKIYKNFGSMESEPMQSLNTFDASFGRSDSRAGQQPTGQQITPIEMIPEIPGVSKAIRNHGHSMPSEMMGYSAQKTEQSYNNPYPSNGLFEQMPNIPQMMHQYIPQYNQIFPQMNTYLPQPPQDYPSYPPQQYVHQQRPSPQQYPPQYPFQYPPQQPLNFRDSKPQQPEENLCKKIAEHLKKCSKCSRKYAKDTNQYIAIIIGLVLFVLFLLTKIIH